jgi:hypothetical protein
MKTELVAACAALLALATAAPAAGQEGEKQVAVSEETHTAAEVLDQLDLTVTPARGQGRAEQRADEEACVERVAGSLDSPVQVDEKTKIGAKKGALGGAAAGLLIGAITGHTVTGAVVGAGTGAVAGSVQKNRASDAEEKERAEATERARKEARSGLTTCLSQRGYGVTSD